MSTNQWFYVEAESSKGPIAEAELAELVHKGALSQASLVWCEGMANWSAASEVAELKSLFNQFISPATPSAPSSSFQLQQPPAMETPVPIFPETSPPVSSSSIPERDWHYAIGNQSLGPIKSKAISEMIKAGEFSPEDTLIWHEGMTNWTPLKEVSELNHLLNTGRSKSVYQSGLVRNINTHSGQLNETTEHYATEQAGNVEAQQKPRLNSRLLGSAQQQHTGASAQNLYNNQNSVKMVRSTGLFYWIGLCQLGWGIYALGNGSPDIYGAIVEFVLFAIFIAAGVLGRHHTWAYLTGTVVYGLVVMIVLFTAPLAAKGGAILFMSWLVRGYFNVQQIPIQNNQVSPKRLS